MKFKSALLTQASGSIGGITFSHNAGGMYTRARATPTKQEQGHQAFARTRMIAAVCAWNLVSEVERYYWKWYGENTDWTNSLGATIKLTGRAHFIRCFCTRNWGGNIQPVPHDGPRVYGLPSFTPPGVTISETTQEAVLSFTNTDDWAIETGGAMILAL
ncbi:unnamed protein product, partial [marine sediment metagenome]